MVSRKNLKRNALISVYDKSDLNKICKALNKHNIDIISTGATAKKIREIGFKCKEISSLTKFKEILNGRVKTLHHKIHASILFNRKDERQKEVFANLNFPRIDFVIVNFYPFLKISNAKKKSEDEKIEMIDIGGPSMIRSASKNFKFVTTICSKHFYQPFISQLNKNNGSTTLKFRMKMAENNFKKTSDYDQSIYKWFSKNKNNLEDNKKTIIKYGENPNQRAYFLEESKNNIFTAKISGKEIGYNNILDISDGINCLNEFKEPTSVIVKHNNPCGVASSKNIKESFIKAYQCDPVSSYGGTILLNKKISEKLALIINSHFFEIIVAPGYTNKAINILKSKKNLIIIDSTNLQKEKNINFRSVNSGTLYQEANLLRITISQLKLVSKKKSSKKNLEDLVFAYKVAKHVKSNAIILASNKQTMGIGAGQMSRMDATRVAIMKYKDFFENKKFVCASDAFFPFTDNIQLLNKYKCMGIVQPSGSKNDTKIINYAEKSNLSLYFVSNRVFKH
mgnify:CR=1 FL=1